MTRCLVSLAVQKKLMLELMFTDIHLRQLAKFTSEDTAFYHTSENIAFYHTSENTAFYQ